MIKYCLAFVLFLLLITLVNGQPGITYRVTLLREDGNEIVFTMTAGMANGRQQWVIRNAG